MAHILAVDDAPEVRTLLVRALERDGHIVTTAGSAAEAMETNYRQMDLILLDVMMPDEDGFSLCRRMRGEVDCPILFLTACEAESDALEGFGLGGDDYIIKPFRIAELRARVNAHLRRQQRGPIRRMTDGPLSFDLAGKALYVGEQRLPLTKTEYAICEELARHPGMVYSREQLLTATLGYDSDSDAAAITEHIKNIRAKLAATGCTPIETVWGIGYKWNKQTLPG